MRPKNLPHAAHDHDSTPVRTRSKSTHVSLATTSPRPRDSLDRAHRPPPQSSREVTYIGALSIERRSNGATRFSLDRTTTSRETDGGRPVDDAPIHSAAREKAHKKGTERTNERTNERTRDAIKRRRDATRRTHDTHTHTHKKPRVGADSPRARARERRRRASPTEDVPAARIRRLVSQSGWKHTHHTPHGTEKERPTRTHKTAQNTQKKPSGSADSQLVPKPVAVGNTHTTHTTHTTHHTHHTPHTARRKRDLHTPTKTYTHPQNDTKHTKQKPSVSADSQLVPKPVLMRPKQA